jgi:hypothetical protein
MNRVHNATQASMGAVWEQRLVALPPLKRGCHVITSQMLKAVPEIAELEIGLVNFFSR